VQEAVQRALTGRESAPVGRLVKETVYMVEVGDAEREKAVTLAKGARACRAAATVGAGDPKGMKPVLLPS